MILLILVLGYAAAVGIIAVIIGIKSLWRYREFITGASMVLHAVVAAVAMLVWFNMITVLLAFVSVYQIVNISRLSTARYQESKAKHLVAGSFMRLVGIQVLLGLAAAATYHLELPRVGLDHLAAVQAAVASAGLVIVVCNVYRSRLGHPNLSLSDKELPTVTVAVPARNETKDLPECLEAILASDYPKLEILVLDDCSSDKTSDVIRSFAHDGVRFIKGELPHPNWLAKNHAYQALYDAASGEIILFCGVDVRFAPHTIRRLVTRVIAGGESMITVMPQRSQRYTLGLVLQPMRYWWELALPRFAMRQPASLSTCWLVSKAALTAKGGLAAIPRSIRPEAYFAREFAAVRSYAFVRSTVELGLETTKGWRDQFQTALRVRYPEVHSRPERVLLLTLFEAVFLLGPFVLLAVTVLTESSLAAAASALACAGLIATHMVIVGLYSPRAIWLALCNFPLVVVAEIIIVNESMRRYEYGAVEWKGRNICLPVLEVIPPSKLKM